MGFFHERLPLSGRGNTVAAAARFPGDSDWFSGHFPENPIVPGIALIALAGEAVIGRERVEGRSMAITGIRRVRFRLPVLPGDEVTVELDRMPDRMHPTYSFNLWRGGESVCSGILTAGVAPP